MSSNTPDQQGARLRALRIAAGFRSARSAALELGFVESTYGAHERGSRAMGVDDAEHYAQRFRALGVHVLARDLLFGGAMSDTGHLGASRTGQKPSNVSGRRPPAGAPMVEAPLPSNLAQLRRLPVFGRFDPAKGEGRLIMDAVAVDHVQGLADLVDVPGSYAVYMPDESMEPKFEAGALLYVHPTLPVRRGNYVVAKFREDGEPVPVARVLKFVQRTPTRLVACTLNPPREIDFEAAALISVERIVGSAEP